MSIRNLPPEQVQQLLNDGHDLILIDVREKWEFEICHIDPSINIPMGDIPALAQDLDGDAQTVLICHHGARSMQVANFLENTGFVNLINLAGGINAWANNIDPNMQQY